MLSVFPVVIQERYAMHTKRALLFLILVTLMACQSGLKNQTEAPKSEGANWSGDMQTMAQDVKNLVPFLYDKDAFQDPRNRETVQRYLRNFAQSAHHVKPEMGKKYLGDDLLVEFSLNHLGADLNRAVQSFEVGQLEYSRSVAKASLSYCFQCHSVTQEGSAAMWDVDRLQNLKLAPLEKADLLVATRRYDKALSHMENLLNSPDIYKNHAFEFEALLRRYLALIIRVEKAPGRALTELNKIVANADTPHYLLEQAEGWRRSLKAWEGERPRKIKNAKDLFEQVEKRFQKAADLQHFEKDHAGDVEYLRATEQLHQGMKLLKTPQEQARALFLLGKAYEVLDELGSWNLHETYYEACVEKDPRAATAKSCFNRLEASLYMGYSGSSGTHLPPDESERLKRLREKMQNR
jgi:hypothetical protein